MKKIAVSFAVSFAALLATAPLTGCEEQRTITIPAAGSDGRPARGEGERESLVDPAVQRANAEADAAKAEAERVRAEADKHDEAADAIEAAARAKEDAAEAKAEAARKQAEAEQKEAEARAAAAATRPTVVPATPPAPPSERLIDVDDGTGPAMDSHAEPSTASDAGPR